MNLLKSVYLKYKTPILYSSGSLVKAFAQIFVGFAVAKYISPSDFGIWTSVSLFLVYANFLQSGVINGLNLELPLAYGRNDDSSAYKLAGTAQTFSIFCSISVLIIGVFYFLSLSNNNEYFKYGILAVSFIASFTFYQNYLLSTFRSNSSFQILSKIQLIEAFMNVSSIFLVIYFFYFGLIFKSVLVLFLFVILLHLYRPIKVGILWDKNSFLLAIKTGFPVFALSILDSFTITFDRLWLIKFSESNDVGLYSFSFYGYNAFLLFSLSVAGYLYPKMTYSYGKNKDGLILWEYVKKITIVMFLIQLIFTIIGYFLIPILIQNYFPNYEKSILAMQVLLLAGVFKGSVIGANALWSMKKWNFMIAYQSINFVLTITFTYIGVYYFNNKIAGASFGLLLANVLNLLSGLWMTYSATHKIK